MGPTSKFQAAEYDPHPVHNLGFRPVETPYMDRRPDAMRIPESDDRRNLDYGTAAPSTGGVLLVGPLPPPPRLGGVETGVAMLLASPLARRLPIHLFNTARKEDPSRPLVHRLAYQLGMLCAFVGALVRHRPSIVHVKTSAGINFFQNAAYALVARACGRKVALQIHDGRFPEFLSASSRAGARMIVAALAAPHRLIALSESWKTYFQGLAPHAPISVVPNGVVTETFTNAPDARERFGIRPGRVAILFVGTRDPALDDRKGLPTLLAAFEQVRRRHSEALLVIAGAAASNRPTDPDRIEVGIIGEAEKASLYRSVDLLVLPSEVENMPNTVLEAMAAGIPVVATRVGAIPEMITHGDTGFLIEVGDVSALAAHVSTLVADPERRRRMGRRAGDAVKRTYDFNRIQERLAEEYATLSPKHVRHQRRETPGTPSPRSRVAWHRHPDVQRRWRLVRRLQTMSGAEIIFRLRTRFDRRSVAPAALRASEHAALGARPKPEDARIATPHVRGFFDASERAVRLALLERERPEVVASIIARANDILTKGVTLLGKHFRPADASFDWLADPDRGRLWPARSLDDADAVRHVDADVKFVWEVNRHQYFVTLARAYAHSGDQRFARAVTDMLRTWHAQNPYGVGVNWASNLEMAVRGLSWVWALQFLLETPALSDEDRETWLVSLRAHRDHIARHLSIYTDATNHLIGEAAALAVLAMWAPEWEHAAYLRDVAFDVLAREVEKQVAPDGTDREQATSYQRFVLDLLLQVIAMSRRTSTDVPAILVARASSMLRAVSVLIDSSGRAPRIGDSDDARGVPFFTDDSWDFRELLSMGSIVLGEAESYSQHHAGYESALWLGGTSALLPRSAPATPQPSFEMLDEGGYAAFRSAEGANRLLFDCGPLGFLPHASHGHADLLSVLVDVGGEEVLVDPGTFAYWDPHGRRDLFRSTAMHNTVEIGGWDQADAFDPFKWLNVPATGIADVRRSGDLAYVEAWHDGYQRLRPAVRHRRAVLAIGAAAWLIVDWLEGDGAQHFVRSFHAAPGCRLERAPSGFIVTTPSKRGLLSARDLAKDGGREGLELGSAPYSERYGHAEPAPAVRIHEEAALPAVRALLLVPSEARAAAPLTLEDCAISETAIWMTVRERNGPRWDIALRCHGAPFRVGRMETDGRAAVIRSTPDSGPAVQVFHGTHAKLCVSR